MILRMRSVPCRAERIPEAPEGIKGLPQCCGMACRAACIQKKEKLLFACPAVAAGRGHMRKRRGSGGCPSEAGKNSISFGRSGRLV